MYKVYEDKDGEYFYIYGNKIYIKDLNIQYEKVYYNNSWVYMKKGKGGKYEKEN